MKSSLSKVFDDISKGAATCDRIFQNVVSSYSVTHYTSQYVFSSANAGTVPTPTDRIYVINTFSDSFEFTKETVSTLRISKPFIMPLTKRRHWMPLKELLKNGAPNIRIL